MKTSLLCILLLLCLTPQMIRADNTGILAALTFQQLTVPATFGQRLRLENTVVFGDDIPNEYAQFSISTLSTPVNFSFVSLEQDGYYHLDFVLTLQNLKNTLPPFTLDVDSVSIEVLDKSGLAGIATDTLDFHVTGNEETTHRFNTLTNDATAPEKLTWDNGLMESTVPPKDTVFVTQLRLDPTQNFATADSFQFNYRVTIHTVPEPSSLVLLLGGVALSLRRRPLR